MSNLPSDIPNETSSFEESQAIEGNVRQTEQEGPPEVPTGEHFPAEHKQVNEEPIFTGQFTYRDYLFDTNSDSTELQPGPSSAAGETLPPQASLPASTVTSISLQPSCSSSGSIVNFGLDRSEHQLHFAEHQQGQQATDFLSSPSAIVGASDSLPSNEFMLFDTSMLDTSTDLSAMQETSGTATATSKVVEYFTSPPPLQSSLPQDSPAMGSMSQQLSLESDHAQIQPQAQLHESDNFVHFHRINGNGVTSGHSDSQVPPNDTNNNPVSEVNEDLKESINSMLVESAAMATSMSDPASTSSTMDSVSMSTGRHLTQQQQQANQYINSNVRQMLDSTNSNNSTTVMDSNGPSHVMMSQELASHPQQMPQQQSLDSQTMSPSVSNEPQANMLNIIPDAYTCFSNEAQMQQHEQNFASNESSLASQQSQSGQEGQSHGPVSNESSLYHSHHHSLQQLQQAPSQQQTSQQQQQQQQQQPSAQHHLSSSSMSVVTGQGNQTNQQMNHHGQSMSHHHLPQHHHSMVANASSTPAMEYGQSQLMPSQSPSMDTVSNNNSSAALQQQQSSQSTNSSSANPNVASVDTMMSQNASVPQTSSVSSSSEIKSESASYANASAEYLLQSAHAPSAQYHHSIHHSEGQMFPSSSSSTSTSLSSSTSSPHSLPPLPNTAHQRTHYMPSNENILTSSSNVVNQSAGANINNNNTNNSGNTISNRSTSSEPGPSTASPSTSANSQILTQFETIDSGSVPSSTLNQQNRYVLIKCDPSVPPLTYQEGPKTHQSVQQMQYDVPQQQQSQSMQSRLSLNEPNTSTSGAIAIQVQQAQPPQQPHLLNSVGRQQGASVGEESSQGQSRAHPGTALNLPPNSQNSQICISLANNAVTSSMQSSQVPTVTLAGMPSNGLRPVCVITDPNVASLPPLHQTTQQAQVNLATFHNLPPKKIRYPNVSTNIISPGSSSLSQSTAPALLFASKSSVMPSVPQSQMSHQPQPQQAQASNVVQAMIVPSNLAFNQAQPIQSQNVGNILASSSSSSSSSTPNLQNVAAKPFVPSSGNTEQNYPQTDILMQRHYTPSSVPPSSTSASVIYQPSEGSSSIQSGSQFNRLPNVSTAPNVASSQAQIFFNSASPHTADIRFLNNYSILSLQPASIQHGQQNQSQANKNQMVPHKILLTHSVPVTDGSHPSGNHSLAPAATALISLNPDFALSSNPGQVALGHLPTLNNGPSSGGANNSGKPGHSLSSGSIILSPIIHNSNIPGSQVTRTVTNFAVPIPVVTSAIGSEQRHQNVTIQFSPASQFASSAFSPNVSQPTIISNLVPSTGAHTALATKSTKMPSSQANKTAPKSGNSSASSKGASGNSGSSSSSGSTSKGVNPPPLMSDDPAKPFKCCLCGKNLASKNVYQLHLRSHSGEKPFVCHLCNNRFSQKTSLTRHMRSHTGERPFPCQVCNKRFADKERIKIHMRIHTGEKPFSCGVCGKKFSQKSTVKRHMSVHTGVKPFKCDVCGKGFANRGNLTAHTKTHQPQQAQQQSRSSSMGTMTSSSNNHQQQAPQSIQQHQMSIELQTQMAATSGNHQSMPGANIVYASSGGNMSSNGTRIEISNIKTESDDVMIETKSSLVGGSSQANNPHNHQFTSATMPQPPQPSKPLSS